METYEPKFLKRWTLPANYAGTVWPNYYSSGFGQSRESSCLERSNFETAWKAIKAVATDAQIVRERHWAVGWVEWIAISADDAPALRVADELRGRYEQCPVPDEDDFSEKEQEEADETWKHCFNPKERLAYIRKHRSQFDFRGLADILGCVRGQYFAGYASELIR